MGCFTLEFLFHLGVWAICLAVVYYIIQILLPYLLSWLPAAFAQIIQIILWGIFAIIALYIVFILLSCLLSFAGGGGSLFSFPRHSGVAGPAYSSISPVQLFAGSGLFLPALPATSFKLG